MVRSLSRQITIGIGVALVLLLINAVISYRNILTVLENARWVSHTQEVLVELERVLSTVKDAETGQRGYLITGQDKYLLPYNNAIANINDRLDTLQQLTSDNPRQQQHVQVLERAINSKLAELQATITLRREQGFEAARRLVQTDQGRNLMLEIRQQVADMEAEENQLLQQRVKESRVSVQRALATFTLATGLALLLLLVIYYLIQRDRNQRLQEAIRQNYLLKQLEQERNYLKESEARYRSLVTATSQAVWVTNPNGEVTSELPLWQALTGQTQDEILGWGWLDPVHPDDRDRTLEKWRQSLEAKTIFEVEHRVRIANGNYRCFQARGIPVLNDRGQLQEWVGIHSDITERKQAEDDIRQLNATLEQRVKERTTQLQEANEELESFAYSVAHDLRAPLRGMHGLAEALVEDYSSALDDLGKEYAHQIVSSAEQLEDLIRDLLAYSHLSRSELKLQSVDLDSAVAEAIAQAKANPESRTAKITVQTPLPAVMAHRTTLVQVLTNLLSNAIKFVEDVEPQVQVWAELPTESFVLSSESSNDPLHSSQLTTHNLSAATVQSQWVRLWIADNGIGIAQEHQDRIFRIFERLHGIETYPGTGIGLAITKKGIERMGGQVGVESQPGHGSRFWIKLERA